MPKSKRGDAYSDDGTSDEGEAGEEGPAGEGADGEIALMAACEAIAYSADNDSYVAWDAADDKTAGGAREEGIERRFYIGQPKGPAHQLTKKKKTEWGTLDVGTLECLGQHQVAKLRHSILRPH